MCGRYTGFTADEEDEIMKLIKDLDEKMEGSETPIAVKHSGEIFPTDIVPVIYGAEDNSLAVQAMKWGYPGYPDRNNPGAKPKPLINAKSETARNLSTWKDSIELRRCIVPSNGFFEWQKLLNTHTRKQPSDTPMSQHGGANGRTKYLFQLPDSEALYMAAIYKEFVLTDAVKMPCFAILTTAANASIADVHSRMPVVLRRYEFEQWLWGDWESLLDRNEIDLERM